MVESAIIGDGSVKSVRSLDSMVSNSALATVTKSAKILYLRRGEVEVVWLVGDSLRWTRGSLRSMFFWSGEFIRRKRKNTW